MKRKKLNLNKTTVSNLHTREMNGVKGGYVPSEDSCAVSIGCPTNHLCDSGMQLCECSAICSLVCPQQPEFP